MEEGETETELKLKPVRILIQIINDFPEDLILEISPQSKTLKKLVMVPLILNLLLTAVQTYTALVLYKLTGELLINDGLKNHTLLTLALPVIGGAQTLFQLYTFNVAMINYEQLTV